MGDKYIWSITSCHSHSSYWWGTSIAQWIRQRFPSCLIRFKTQDHSQIFALSTYLSLHCEKNENNGLGPFYKISIVLCIGTFKCSSMYNLLLFRSTLRHIVQRISKSPFEYSQKYVDDVVMGSLCKSFRLPTDGGFGGLDKKPATHEFIQGWIGQYWNRLDLTKFRFCKLVMIETNKQTFAQHWHRLVPWAYQSMIQRILSYYIKGSTTLRLTYFLTSLYSNKQWKNVHSYKFLKDHNCLDFDRKTFKRLVTADNFNPN